MYQQSKTIQPVSVQSPGNSWEIRIPLHIITHTKGLFVCMYVCMLRGEECCHFIFLKNWKLLFLPFNRFSRFSCNFPTMHQEKHMHQWESGIRNINKMHLCSCVGQGKGGRSWCNLATDYSLWTMPIAEAASSPEQPFFACNLREIFHHFPSHFQMLTYATESASTAASSLSSSFLCSALILSVAGAWKGWI